MSRRRLDDLTVFMTVAEEKSFTRAAGRLGISQSALSHAIKALETELDVRLLARTTRSVQTTQAGERLLQRLRPAVNDIDAALDDLRASRAKPSGTVRITTMKHAAQTVIEPALPAFFAANPGVTVEIAVEEGLTDIVASRFDAGIRFGESLDRDMIAVRVGDDLRTAICGSPEYFAKHPPPRTPRDLLDHDCINYRFHTSGNLYAWEFTENGRPVTIKVPGKLIVNEADVMMSAALQGHGLAHFFEDMVEEHIATGRLVRVLTKYCEPYPGYYLYYPSTRKSAALGAFIEAIRYRSRGRKTSKRG